MSSREGPNRLHLNSPQELQLVSMIVSTDTTIVPADGSSLVTNVLPP